jgi:hypothetical protein
VPGDQGIYWIGLGLSVVRDTVPTVLGVCALDALMDFVGRLVAVGVT